MTRAEFILDCVAAITVRRYMRGVFHKMPPSVRLFRFLLYGYYAVREFIRAQYPNAVLGYCPGRAFENINVAR